MSLSTLTRSPGARRRYASRTAQVLAAAVVLAGAAPDEAWTLPLYGIAILAAPPILGRLCGRRLGPLQRTWLSVGLAVHPVGALYDLYPVIWWYDHLAHAASASLLAGGAYLVVGALAGDDSRRDVPALGHLAVLGAVVLGGVGWELLELRVAYLVVHGTEDTLADMSYNLLGWLAVAPRWRALLGERPRGLARRFRGRDLAVEG